MKKASVLEGSCHMLFSQVFYTSKSFNIRFFRGFDQAPESKLREKRMTNDVHVEKARVWEDMYAYVILGGI